MSPSSLHLKPREGLISRRAEHLALRLISTGVQRALELLKFKSAHKRPACLELTPKTSQMLLGAK